MIPVGSRRLVCHFPKSSSAPSVEISRFLLPYPTAILLKVVGNIRRFAKDDRNLVQDGDRAWSMCRWVPEAAWCEARRRAGVPGDQVILDNMIAMGFRNRRRESTVRGF
jgi:hypothetical protein